MKKSITKLLAGVFFLLMTVSCGNSGEETQADDQEITEENKEDYRVGGFLPKKPFSNETVGINDRSVIIKDFNVVGFPKKMETYGTLFAIMPNVPDDFINEVAVAFHEMFPQDSSMDLEMQQNILNSMKQYKSCIPVLEGRYEEMSEEVEGGFDALSNRYSVCDIIMYKDGTGRQTMEVVEHLLHYVTSIGLHLSSPEYWSFSEPNSEVTKVMNKAIALGLYDISSYDDILDEDQEAYQRVIIQEFAYWLITTYWNLQVPYGPLQEEEWNVDNKEELLNLLPEGYNLVEKTVDTYMRAPSHESLEKFRKYN